MKPLSSTEKFARLALCLVIILGGAGFAPARAEGAEFLLCPSGGMFGPKTNDHFLQERSRGKKVHIVFVDPCEFLVTGPDGAILTRTLLGDSLLVSPAQIGSERDLNRVFYFDLPIMAK